MNQACLNLGSNHRPEQNIDACLRHLRRQCNVLAVSRVYETPAIDRAQPGQTFLNAAVLIATPLTAEALRDTVLRPIETRLGRRRGGKRGDTVVPIDIDITVFGDQRFCLGKRRIPDPDIARYPHVALPLAEVLPHYFHRETGESIGAIVSRLRKQR